MNFNGRNNDSCDSQRFQCFLFVPLCAVMSVRLGVVVGVVDVGNGSLLAPANGEKGAKRNRLLTYGRRYQRCAKGALTSNEQHNVPLPVKFQAA